MTKNFTEKISNFINFSRVITYGLTQFIEFSSEKNYVLGEKK